jgi:hypothetical protein
VVPPLQPDDRLNMMINTSYHGRGSRRYPNKGKKKIRGWFSRVIFGLSKLLLELFPIGLGH